MPCSLYRFYDAHDVLLYVGITSVGPHRWKQHALEKGWWTQVARTTVEHYGSRAEAMAAEKAAIQAEKPAHNIIHTGERAVVPEVFRKHRTGSMAPRADGNWTVGIRINGKRRQWTVPGEHDAATLLAALDGRTASKRVREAAAEILLAGSKWKVTPGVIGRPKLSEFEDE